MRERVLGLFLTLFCIIALCFATACNMRGKIESVNGHPTIYRHKVKSVQLINSDSENHEVLQTAEGFKYFYSSSDFLLYKTYEYDFLEAAEYYFPELTFLGNACQQHSCNTEILILFDGVDKEYRPSFSVKNDIATVEYFEAQLSTNYAYKQEIDYEAAKNLEKEVMQKQLELLNDSEAFETYCEDLEEEYKYTQVVYSQKISVSLSYSFSVTYHN